LALDVPVLGVPVLGQVGEVLGQVGAVLGQVGAGADKPAG